MLPKTAIAHHLNADPSLVSRWAARGMPLDSLEAAAAWHSAHIRTRRKRRDAARPPAVSRSGGNGHLGPRDRLDLAKAKLAELELSLKEGKLLWADQVSKSATRAGMTIRDGMLSVPGRIACQLAVETDERNCERIMDGEIRRELSRLALLSVAPAGDDPNKE